MARPSVTAERREEILDAFAHCVARDGVEGASLQQVADAAGLARALLRHHLGNREDMILALAERFCRQSLEEMDELIALLPKKKRLEKLIAVLFTAAYASSNQELQVAGALVNAAASRPILKKMLRRWYDGFEDLVAEELRTAYPAAKPAAVAEVATAIVGMAFSVDSLTPLGKVDDIFRRSGRAALRVAATLEN
ncbi:TetR/AcrR family transcriptional regulator [Pelagibius sp.]|uniref:TetR/AcrR family transcriptional regulator n=1 Tax=Pelagibius sp. TaxID=1931238 RepID=UPI003BB178DE